MSVIYRTPAPHPQEPKMPLLLRVLLWFSELQIVRQYFGGHWERYRVPSTGFYLTARDAVMCSWGSWTPVDCCIAKTRSIEALAKCAVGFQCEDWPEEDIFRKATSRDDLLSKAVDHFDIPTPATTPEALQYLEMK